MMMRNDQHSLKEAGDQDMVVLEHGPATVEALAAKGGRPERK
jgi:hypothetical protein